MENIVLYIYAKNDDRLWNEKALVLWKSDNNENTEKKNNNVGTLVIGIYFENGMKEWSEGVMDDEGQMSVGG